MEPMSTFIQDITDKAVLCGWTMAQTHSDGRASLTVETTGVAEHVHVRPCGNTPEGDPLLLFASDGMPFPVHQGRLCLLAIMLLERNADRLWGHWGIEAIDGTKAFIVCLTQNSTTMDVEAFRAAVDAILAERRWIREDLQRSSVRLGHGLTGETNA